jgi:hypothetical protein
VAFVVELARNPLKTECDVLDRLPAQLFHVFDDGLLVRMETVRLAAFTTSLAAANPLPCRAQLQHRDAFLE